MGLTSRGQSTKFQVPFASTESYSLIIASCHYLCPTASTKEVSSVEAWGKLASDLEDPLVPILLISS